MSRTSDGSGGRGWLVAGRDVLLGDDLVAQRHALAADRDLRRRAEHDRAPVGWRLAAERAAYRPEPGRLSGLIGRMDAGHVSAERDC